MSTTAIDELHSLTQKVLDAVDAEDWLEAAELAKTRDRMLRVSISEVSRDDLLQLSEDDKLLSEALHFRRKTIQTEILQLQSGRQAVNAYQSHEA